MYAELIEALASHKHPNPEECFKLHLADIPSAVLGQNVPTVALVPAEPGASTPVLIHLDGGVGQRESLIKRQHLISNLTITGVLPPAIRLSFSGGANVFYTGPWEQWVCEELPAWANSRFGVDVQRDCLLLTGISAGGHGALKLAFKYPDRFAAVAAMEPVIMPTLTWPEQHTRASWWMLEASARAVWGEPFPDSFLNNHPPNLIKANAQDIISSGLHIYLEVGDEDLLHLQDGAEFIHRLMWDHQVPHEYHLVRWADHGGHSLNDRFIEAMRFLAAAYAGGTSQSRDMPLSDAEQRMVDYVLGGGPLRGEAPPPGASAGDANTELTVMNRLWSPLRVLAEARDEDMFLRYGPIS